jgi:hypothetical protein
MRARRYNLKSRLRFEFDFKLLTLRSQPFHLPALLPTAAGTTAAKISAAAEAAKSASP